MERKLTFTQNALWNTGGCIWFNLCLWAVTMAAVRLSEGYENAGRLQLAMTVTNVFALIASGNMKTYMVSDVEGRITAGEYRGTQLVASGIGALLCLGYVLLCGYPGDTVMCILAYMLFRVTLTWGETCMGVEQRHERMDLVGISNLLRGTLLLIFFALTLCLTDSVTLASLAMAASSVLVLLLYDKPRAGSFEDVRPVLHASVLKGLLRQCAPMVISLAVFTAAVTVPRQLLSARLGEETLGYYASVATPVVVIQVLVTGIFDPVLRRASLLYENRELAALKRLGARLGLILLIITLTALTGARLLGEPVLALLYGDGIRPHAYLLAPVILCTSLYCLCWIVSTMLVVMRRLKAQLVCSLLSLGLSALLAGPWIGAYGPNGVSFAVMAGYTVCFLTGGACILHGIQKEKR